MYPGYVWGNEDKSVTLAQIFAALQYTDREASLNFVEVLLDFGESYELGCVILYIS